MNRLSTERRGHAISCLVEGMSIRGTVRITGVAKNTITKLLLDLGEACSAYQDDAFRNLKMDRIQCDEIWSFIHQTLSKKAGRPTTPAMAAGVERYPWTTYDLAKLVD